jgi:hypothetical protein
VRTLEGQDGLRYATVKILTVNESRGIEVPAGSRGPDGRPLGPDSTQPRSTVEMVAGRRVVTHGCPSGQERCGLSKVSSVRAEGHPLDATVSRFVGVVGDVR